MNQAVKCDLYLYADNSCFIFQHKEVTETKKKLTKYFSNICDWFVDFVDNELIINQFGIKLKSVLFSSRHNSKLVGELQ